MCMAKCVITGELTHHKTKNIPLKKEANVELTRIHEDFNSQLKEAFVSEQKENNSNIITPELLERMAPKFSKAKILREIEKHGVDGLYAELNKAKEAVEKEREDSEESDEEK